MDLPLFDDSVSRMTTRSSSFNPTDTKSMGLEQFSTRGERPYCRSWRAAFGIYLLPQETSRLGILRFRGSIVGVVGEGGAAGWRERRVGGGHGRWAGVSASAGT